MKLKAIDIAGFRGFASRRQFDLSADATVVIGVNGLGKTSLFDAILWGLCGEVARVGSDDRLVSMYSDTGEARVSVLLATDRNETVKVTRTSDGTSQSLQLSIAGANFKATSAAARLLEMLWPDAASASDGASALTSAFVRSVYLQQDSVRDFLEAASDQDRFNVITELLGVGRLTELQLQLERERNSWTRAITQRTKDMTPLAHRVTELEKQLQTLKSSSDVDEDASRPSWEDWWPAATKLGVTIPGELPSAASVEASSVLASAIQHLQSLAAQNGTRRATSVALQELLAAQPPEPKSSTDALRTQAAQANLAVQEARSTLDAARKQAAANRALQVEAEELIDQERALAQIAIKLLGEHCPVCAQSYNVEQTKARLEQLANQGAAETTSTVEPRDIIADLAKAEEAATAVATEAKSALDRAERARVRHNQWKEDARRSFEELELPGSETESRSEQVVAAIADCTRRHEQLVAHRKAGERLALNLARESARSRIAGTENDLQKAKRELATHRLVIESREVTGSVVNQLLEALRQSASRVTVDRLKHIEPVLQRMYARIDPHPAFRVVKLVSRFSRGRGRLDAHVHDTEEGLASDSPSAVLSSSQLNALAVSLFLSLNLSLPRLPVEAALLDDPIQSLDDVNLLGLVDLLRRTKDKRQLLVTTHDIRFGKLLSRKLRPGSESQTTSVIELSGWSRSGPDVRQFAIEPESKSLKLVHAG